MSLFIFPFLLFLTSAPSNLGVILGQMSFHQTIILGLREATSKYCIQTSLSCPRIV